MDDSALGVRPLDLAELNRFRERDDDPTANPFAAYLPERWWIVFSPKTRRWHWWAIYTEHRPEFAHCFALTTVRGGITLAMNPQPGGVEHYAVTGPVAPLIDTYLKAGCRVLVAKLDNPVYRFVPRGPLVTCATILAYTIGLKFRWGFTPYQLYRRMKRAGCKELKRG